MLSFFNLFSQLPSLRINGKIRPTSIFGSIIGFFAIMILLAGLTFILHNFFSRLSYTINSFTDNLAKPEINLKNFNLGFQVIDAYGTPFPDHDRLFQISALYWDVYLPKIGENKTQKIEFTNIPTIKCDQYKNDNLHKEIYDTYSKMYKNMICIDIPSLNQSLKGVYGNLGT